MPVYTFSTKHPADTELVERLKDDCAKQHKTFSGLIIELLREQEKRDEK